jgi:hypothetical protein
VPSRIVGTTEAGSLISGSDTESIYYDLLAVPCTPGVLAWLSPCRSGCHDFVSVAIQAGTSRSAAVLGLAEAEAFATHILREVERAREARLASAPPPPPIKKGPTT